MHGKFFAMIALSILIAIIAILASLLLFALNQARDKARSMRCVNNLFQVFEEEGCIFKQRDLLFSDRSCSAKIASSGQWMT